MPHPTDPESESTPNDVGYHMSGLPLHDEPSALKGLAKLGYRTLALVPRRTSLLHDHPGWKTLVDALMLESSKSAMRLILDLDGLFTSDPFTRACPSLASLDEAEGDQAVEHFRRWIRSAGEMGISLVTFPSGSSELASNALPEMTQPAGSLRSMNQGTQVVWDQLGPRIGELLRFAQQHDVTLAIRPTVGNAVSTTAHYETLLQWIDSDEPLHLIADVDAMIQGGEFPIAARLIRHLPTLSGIFLDTSHFTQGSRGDLHLDVGRLYRNLMESGFEGPWILRAKYHLPFSHCPPGLDDAERAWTGLHATRSIQP